MKRHIPIVGVVAALATMATGAPVSSPTAAAQAASSSPNVITIMADDLGYGDTSLYGGTIHTPNIDRLAASGVTFTDGYVGSPVCSPSRWSLMSGQEAPRIGADGNQLSRRQTLPEFGPDIPSFTGELQDSGYRTMAIGKWDLSGVTPRTTEEEVGNHPNLPHQVGFDEYWGVLAGISPYCVQNDPHTWALDPATGSYRQEAPTEYLTDEFTRRAVDFVEQREAEPDPFFLYLTYNAPHNPFETRDECDNPPKSDVAERQRRYEEMVRIMDEGIGQVIDSLDDDTRQNTIITFLSDNGPQHGWVTGPLRGRKSMLFEGGIRVPFVMAWPGQLPAGVISEVPVRSHDLAPTYLTAAGVPLDDGRYPGSDLVSRVVGGGTDDRPYVWRYYNDSGPTGGIQVGTTRLAVRDGDWKWVRDILPDGVVNEYLFDLAHDLGEQTNLVGRPEHAARLQRMRLRYRQWAETVDHHAVLDEVRTGTGRPDGTTVIGGSWAGDDTGFHAAAPVDGTGPGTALMPGTHHVDDRTTLELELGPEGQAGLVVRGLHHPGDQALTGYVATIGADQIVLARHDEGRATVLATTPVPTTGTQRLEVIATGGQLEVRLAGRVVLAVTDSDPLEGGSTGLRIESGTATFHDLDSVAS